MYESIGEPAPRAVLTLVDLVRFLSELGKSGPFAVGREQVARRWQILQADDPAAHRLRRTSYQTAARNDPAFTWLPAYSTVAGELPLADLFSGHLSGPP